MLFREALAVMRKAGTPMTVSEIADAMLRSRNRPASSRAAARRA